MDLALLLMKLGTEIVGSNFDLTPLPRDNSESDEGSGSGDSESE